MSLTWLYALNRAFPWFNVCLLFIGVLQALPAFAQDKQVANHFLVTPRNSGLNQPGFQAVAHPFTGEVGFVITGGTQAAGNGIRIVTLEHGNLLKRCPPEDFYCSQQTITVASDAVFGVWIYQGGNQVFHQTYPSFGESFTGGEVQDIEFTFLDGENYTVLAGFRSSIKCNPNPCLYAPARLFWKLEDNGNQEYALQTPEKATWPISWGTGGGFNGQPPVELIFHHETRPLVPQLQPVGWQLYPTSNTTPQQGIATNYGVRLEIEAPESVRSLTWVFLLPDGSMYENQTQFSGTGGGGFGYTLPDLSLESTLLGTTSGFDLELHLTNHFGIRGSTTIPLTSFRLLDPTAILWDLRYVGASTVHQNGLATNRLTQTNQSVCNASALVNDPNGFFRLEARVNQWGPSIGATTVPGEDYQLTAGMLVGIRSSGNPTIKRSPASTVPGQPYRFDFSYNSSVDAWSWRCGPGQAVPCLGSYQGGNYTELALLKVVDSRSGNVHLGPDGEPGGMHALTWFDGPGQQHRLRLINEACTITSSLTFLDTQAPHTPVTSYRFTPGSDRSVFVRAVFDGNQTPIDAIRMRFFRDGLELGSCYHQVYALPSGVNDLLTIPSAYLPLGGPIDMILEGLHTGQQAGCDPSHAPVVSGQVRLVPNGIAVPGLTGLATEINDCEDAIISPLDGSLNLRFLPQVQGGPFNYEWRWSRSEGGTTYYWTGSGWTIPTNPDLLFQPVTGAGSTFWSRWTMANSIIQPKSGVPPPFSGLVTSFFRFGSPATDRERLETTVELRVLGTTNAVRTAVMWHKRGACELGPGPQKVKQLLVSLDATATPQPTWVDAVAYTSGEANRLRLRVDTDDTTNQSTAFSQYWLRLNTAQGIQLRCQRVTTDWTVSYIAGAGMYELEPTNTTLLGLLNQVGATSLELLPNPAPSCPSVEVDDRFRISLSVNPVPVQTPRLRVKLHYRDHLGSSWVTKTFRPMAGQTRALEGGAITIQTTAGSLVLTGEAPQYHSYEPFGERLDASNNRTRYTDHEHDETSSLTYMKGRYQLATATKFTRPDPMRDWDWTNPNSINLYQYVHNDPINRFDPDGLTDIYIGGLGDKDTTLVKRYYEEQIQNSNGERTIAYFQQNQFKEVLEFAEKNSENGEPLNIIGHSYGANTAANLALSLSDLNITVDNLIGVDPVSKATSKKNQGEKQQKTLSV